MYVAQWVVLWSHTSRLVDLFATPCALNLHFLSAVSQISSHSLMARYRPTVLYLCVLGNVHPYTNIYKVMILGSAASQVRQWAAHMHLDVCKILPTSK